MGFFEKCNFVTTVMAVGKSSSSRSFPLRRTPFKIKISAYYCISHVLKPMLEIQLPKLYPGEDQI